MKKIIPLVILLSIVIFCVGVKKSSQTKSSQDSPANISGAYEALNFFGARQTYPNNTLPADAHYAAWEKWNSNNALANRSTTLPWETLGPHNRGGRTLALALNPQNTQTLYAGSASGGLWRSTTAGVGVEAWEIVETGFPVLAVSTIAIHPTDSMIMYIGTGEVYNHEAAGTGAAYRSTRGSYGMGILKTTDGGQTWSHSLNWSYTQQHGIWMIKIDPQYPNRIFAATTQGIYKSTDAGSSWNKVLNQVLGTDILIHPNDSNNIVAAVGNFASPGYGIYKTVDGGSNWQQIISNLPTIYEGKIQLGLAPSDPEIIYASIGNGFSSANGATWLCRSDDFGTNWTVKNTEDYSRYQGWFAHDVAVSPVNPDRIITIGIQVWSSVDGGDLLNLLTGTGFSYPNPPIEGPDGNSTYVHVDAHDVMFHPTDSNKIYIANDGGIHRSDDGGATWYSANGGYQTTQFYNGISTSQNDPGLLIGGLQDNGTIQWNGDLTWTHITGGDGSWTAIHPNNDNIFFTSAQRLYGYKTEDGGNSFSRVDYGTSYLSPAAFIAPYVIAPSNGQVMYAGTANMAKSQDSGNTWNAINAGNPLDGNPILSMEVSPSTDSVVYAGTAPYNGARGHVFVTQDGNLFSDVTGNLPDRYPMDITVDPIDPAIAYVVFSGFGTGHVFKTQDYGNTWTDISDNLPDVPANAIIVDPAFPNNVYVGNDLGVFVSTEGGMNWDSYQEGLSTAAMVFDLKISMPNRKLRVAIHGNGAYERDLLSEPVASIGDLKDGDFELKVFPNPVEDVATIQFEKKRTGIVQLDFLDINGRVVKEVFNESLGIGTQSINVDLADVSSGIYLVRMMSGGYAGVYRVVKR